MKDGYDNDVVVFDHKNYRVGKSIQKDTSDVRMLNLLEMKVEN